MKTILLPIYAGGRAKSFFYTDIYSELVSNPDIRLVVAVPSAKLSFYKSNFPEKNVTFEPLDIKVEHELGRKLNRVAFNLMPTSSVRGKLKLVYLHRYKNYPKYFLMSAANYIFGVVPFLKSAIRYLDRFVPLDSSVENLLKKYNPALVIIPDIVFGPDRVFLRAAKRLGFFVIGMARSWDNLVTKGFVQVLPDKLIIYTPTMVGEALKYVGMKKNDVFMAGPPQFDMYYKSPSFTREAFLKKLGIPEEKKIVVAAPFFDRYTGSAVIMINELTRAIEDGRLPQDTHILVRYRPATPPIKEGLLRRSPHLTVTEPCVVKFDVLNLQTPEEDFEWTRDDIELLDGTLRYGDVVINTVSTLSIDAAAFDKPVVNVRFDADPNCSPEHSVPLFIRQHGHYRAIEESGGVKLVGNMNELIKAVNAYLKNPKLDSKGRERLRQEQIVFTDGLAGKRIADFIKTFL